MIRQDHCRGAPLLGIPAGRDAFERRNRRLRHQQIVFHQRRHQRLRREAREALLAAHRIRHARLRQFEDVRRRRILREMRQLPPQRHKRRWVILQ